MKLIDLTGKTFHYLYVEGPGTTKHFPNGSWQRTWVCKCECGKKVEAISAVLLRGVKKSCGCKNFTGEHKNAKFPPQETSWKSLHQRTKQNAKTRKIEFNLTPLQHTTISQLSCTYCGIPPSMTFNVYASKNGKTRTVNVDRCHEGWINHSTIDRIDSSLGYTINNVVPACFACNTAKGTMNSNEFYTWIRRISNKWEQSDLSVFQTHITTISQSISRPEIS